MKRELLGEKEKTLLKRVETEHESFKYKMLSASVKDIYDHYNKISFYECCFEYFEYCENIKEEHIEACLKCINVIESLYNLYIECEYLKYHTWKEIEEILSVMVDRQEKYFI